jgi:hypothetical protein
METSTITAPQPPHSNSRQPRFSVYQLGISLMCLDPILLQRQLNLMRELIPRELA